MFSVASVFSVASALRRQHLVRRNLIETGGVAAENMLSFLGRVIVERVFDQSDDLRWLLSDPRVVASYLGTDDRAIARSGTA